MKDWKSGFSPQESVAREIGVSPIGDGKGLLAGVEICDLPAPDRTFISRDRQAGTLTCEEAWSDGRKASVVFDERADAWLEIGRGLDKNIPMG